MQSTIVMMHSLWSSVRLTCLACVVVFGLVSGATAQQPTAAIVAMDGEVVAIFGNGTSAPGSIGLTLFQADSIQTKAGAFAVLELSDGSQLELGENTNILMEQLAVEPYSQARVSRVKLWWGKMRAGLSPGHQQAGAAFDIQTPNSLVGVKFSKPDLEVEFDASSNTTRVFAYTVDLVVLNLLSGVSQTVVAGTGALVVGNGIQLLSQIPQTAAPSQHADMPPSSQPATPLPVESAGSGGILSGNMGAIAVAGLGAAAVAGGIAALSAAEKDESSENIDFSGTFRFIEAIEAGVTRTAVMRLSQQNSAISGILTETFVVSGCCTAVGTGEVNGNAQGNVAILNVRQGAAHCSCGSTWLSLDEKFVKTAATLEQNGSILNFDGQLYGRQ